ncbi:hypothetical protein [Friedmanniella luteola]|uniref:hypothetical protein n=1 Tax=Friedmanniella luteola TaxID=546871 RepID=UPI000B8229EC|nr:hypothetical protein [Friedmanniella luteola]
MPQMPGEDLPAPTRLGALELDLAPDSPGIYAWYPHLALSPDDWKPRLVGGVDAARVDLLHAIEDYARIHESGAVDLKGSANYGLYWHGRMQRLSVAARSTETGESLAATHLAELAADPDDRRILTDLLRMAPPYFASPVYIGVATNLRERLAEHRVSFERANKLLRNQPDRASELQFRGTDLGARLAGAGIPLERLDCWILAAPGMPHAGDDQKSKQRSVAAAAEWVLQRIFQPILGRQ